MRGTVLKPVQIDDINDDDDDNDDDDEDDDEDDDDIEWDDDDDNFSELGLGGACFHSIAT